jgi:hypothetical protein
MPNLDSLSVLAGALLVALIVGLVWWMRMAANRPQKALLTEAKFDAFVLGLREYAPDQADAILEKIAAKDLTAAGAQAWATLEPRLNAIEAKVNELLKRIPRP